MRRTKIVCSLLLVAIALTAPSSLTAQFPSVFGKGKGLPKIPIVRDGLPALANPVYGEVMLSGNEALLEPAWLVGSLRDNATGQVLKWNNYLLPDAKPNVKLLTDTVFEGFVDSSAVAKAEWLSSLHLHSEDHAVAEVVVTRVSVTSVSPKQIDRNRLLQEIAQRLPPDQQNRYSVIIAYVDIAITATRFQHYETDGDVTGYGGRIGGDWYYKDKQKSTDHRLVAISAPLEFAVTTLAQPNAVGQAAHERPCYELVGEAIRQGTLKPENARSLCIHCCPEGSCPLEMAANPAKPDDTPLVANKNGAGGLRVGNNWGSGLHPSDPAASGASVDNSPHFPWADRWGHSASSTGENGYSASSLPSYNPPAASYPPVPAYGPSNPAVPPPH